MRHATLIALGAAMFILACGSGMKIPAWYTNAPKDPNYIFAVSESEGRSIQNAVDKARGIAQANIAQQLQVRVRGMETRIREEAGSEYVDQWNSAIQSVFDEMLNFARVSQQEVTPKNENTSYQAFLLMEMPVGAANQAIMDKVRQNRELYNRIRATQLYNDMQKQVEKYNQSRGRQ